MSFVPMNKSLLVQIESNTVSSNGIEVCAKLPYKQGVIVAFSKDCEQDIKEGDSIYFENVGLNMTLEGREYFLISEKYLLGKVN